MKLKNLLTRKKLINIVMWTACGMTTVHVGIAANYGASEEGGRALGRAVVCGLIGIVAYILSDAEEIK